MKDILYKVSIEDGSEYSVYAKTINMAKHIAIEIHKAENGFQNAKARVVAEPVKPTNEELQEVNSSLINVYGVLKNVIEGNGNNHFIDVLDKYNGYEYESDGLQSSFYINFRGFTCKVVFVNNSVGIDEKEVSFYSHKFNRTYIIRKGLSEISIGV